MFDAELRVLTDALSRQREALKALEQGESTSVAVPPDEVITRTERADIMQWLRVSFDTVGAELRLLREGLDRQQEALGLQGQGGTGMGEQAQPIAGAPDHMARAVSEAVKLRQSGAESHRLEPEEASRPEPEEATPGGRGNLAQAFQSAASRYDWQGRVRALRSGGRRFLDEISGRR